MGGDRLDPAVKARHAADEARLRRYAAERNGATKKTIVHPDQVPDGYFPFERETFIDQVAQTNLKVAQTIQKVPIFANVNTLFFQYAVPILVVVLIGGGIALAVISIQNNLAVKEQIDTYAQSAADSGEVSVSDSDSAFAASTDPRHPVKIEFSSLDVTANTTQVGLNSKGNIGTPASIKELGWYDNSSSPIDATGSALVVGHVGSPTYPGILANLYKIEQNALIKVTMGDGKVVEYTVTQIEDLPVNKVDMGVYLPKPEQTTRQLTIITCTGDYNARTHSYDDRLIVVAVAR